MKTEKQFRVLANLKIFMVLQVIAAIMVAFSSCSQNKNSEAATSEITPPPPPPPPPSSADFKNNIKIVKEEGMEESELTPFVVVEEMPKFQGGNTALLKYVSDNVVYPETAKEKNIQGRVLLNFCVTSKGKVNQITILKGVDPELDTEAIRVVKSLPEFEPGRQGGKAVPVWFQIPITFSLK